MRDSPQGIRSVILDSAYPLQVNAYTEFLPNADRAISVLFMGCTADPICRSAYPELERTFFQTVNALNNAPVTLSITNPQTGEHFDAVLNGDGLIGFIFQSIHFTDLIPLLPGIIFDARNGNYDVLAGIHGTFLTLLDGISIGMHFSVQCGEELRFASEAEIVDASEAYPQLRGIFDREPIFTFCQIWGAKDADPIENEPVKSDIPTLVLAGEYDPITPPIWGQLAAEGLTNSFFFEFPSVGHGVGIVGGCPLTIIFEFLDNPGVEPDTSCVSAMGAPKFSLPN